MIGNAADRFTARVIACAAQHEVVRCKHGIVANASALCDPGYSASAVPGGRR